MISINPYIILFQMINFGLLVWLLNRFALGPLLTFLEKREQSIKGALHEADASKIETQRLLNEHKALLKNAQQEAKDIRLQAEAAAKKEREIILSKAQEDSARVVENAKQEIEQSIIKAKTALKSEVGSLAITLSEKLLKKDISKQAQQDVLSDYLATPK
jgi:F-type H+-transporting ATPase subunit b